MVNVLERGAAGFFAAFCGDDQGSVVQHAGISPVTFHYAITCGPGRCRIHSEHADEGVVVVDSAKFSHGHKSTAFALLRPENLCLTVRNERSANKKWPGEPSPLAICKVTRF